MPPVVKRVKYNVWAKGLDVLATGLKGSEGQAELHRRRLIEVSRKFFAASQGEVGSYDLSWATRQLTA